MSYDATADVRRFDEASDWFAGQSPVTPEVMAGLDDYAAARAWTISGVAQLDAVEAAHKVLQDAIDSGQKLETTMEKLEVALADYGFGGHRLETIVRTNEQLAYNAGRYAQLSDPDLMAVRPYRQFDGIGDFRQSDICRARDGVTLPADHPWWSTNLPPLHHRCRSTWRALAAWEAERVPEAKRVVPDDLDEASPGFGLTPDLDVAWRPDVSDSPQALAEAFETKQREAAEVLRQEQALAEKKAAERREREERERLLREQEERDAATKREREAREKAEEAARKEQKRLEDEQRARDKAAQDEAERKAEEARIKKAKADARKSRAAAKKAAEAKRFTPAKLKNLDSSNINEHVIPSKAVRDAGDKAQFESMRFASELTQEEFNAVSRFSNGYDATVRKIQLTPNVTDDELFRWRRAHAKRQVAIGEKLELESVADTWQHIQTARGDASHLTSALEKWRGRQSAIDTVYRGMGAVDSELLGRWVSEGTFDFRGQSTSTTWFGTIARSFMDQNAQAGKYNVLLRIKTRSGVPIETISDISSERELLMRGDSRFRITSVKRLTGGEGDLPFEGAGNVLIEAVEI
jgi:SPP1 gp7 family putative phage head morphogenesis protein